MHVDCLDLIHLVITFRISIMIIKADANKETLLQKQKCIQDAKNVFGKFQKHFLLSRCRFCVFNICCIGEQMRNHLGNTEETLTFNVSRMFPRLCTQATYLEDVEFVSRKQKCFASFPFAHPYNTVSNIDSKCFCSNVFSFAPTLTRQSWSFTFYSSDICFCKIVVHV